MTVSITITPKTKSVLIDVSNLEGTHKRGLYNALQEIGSEVVREVRRLIKNTPKTGRVYTIKGKQHQASAPWEAPASRTGRLLRSSRFKARNHQEMTVGETAEYAGYLEDGTPGKKIKGGPETRKDGTQKRTKGGIAPRPHLIVAVNNKVQDTVNSILDSVKREIRG